MRSVNGTRLYSATDLIAYLGCTHATALDALVLSGELAAGEEIADEYLDLLKKKGIEHERRHLDALRAGGRSISEISDAIPNEERVATTIAAMREGIDVIYQGTLHLAPWMGYSDFLTRVDTPSNLGAWSYEVSDTKLARTAKPKHVMQLCVYSRLVEAVQGALPVHAHVVLGDGTSFRFRVADYVHYCDGACARFVGFVSEAERKTIAEPCGHCEFCRWEKRCDAEWESADHLSIVARLNRAQRARLADAGITTIRALAELDEAVSITGFHPDTLHRARSQAKLQHIKRTTNQNRVEILPLEPRRGFARLPKPAEGDLFFDMEGDPIYSAEGGLEYLFGFHYKEGGEERFKAFWAEDRASEKKAFEDAMDFMTTRLEQYPNAYIYHYASYEETALKRLALQYGCPKKQVDAIKRLAQQHGTRENQVDDLLRDRKLVDLYKVVREAVRTSEPRYSLKNLETFFAEKRTQAIADGGNSIVVFERWLALRDDRLLKQIEEYNAFDCRSTMLCRDWLVGLRPSEVEWFDPATEAAADEAERAREERRRIDDLEIDALRAALLDGAGDDRDELTWRELLGHLLEYHRREARREWWEYFKRREMRTEELIDDASCLGGLTVDTSILERMDKRSRVVTLRFPDQDTKLSIGPAVRADTGETLQIVEIDEKKATLALKIGPSRQPLAAEIGLIPDGPRKDAEQRAAIRRYAEAVVAGRGDDYAAVTSILRRTKPRLRDDRILTYGEDLFTGTIDAVSRMENTHLVIQGPPGSGKTYTSAHAIVTLLRAGKRVGVTALSHKAINNLLAQVERVAVEQAFTFKGAKKYSDREDKLGGWIIEDVKDNASITDEHKLVGGTAWLFSRDENDRAFDYLFVDEAGQMSLADVVATGVSAHNIVLVGDQMQLSQPVKGAHPAGSGISALDHLMRDWSTVPSDRGIFLSHTWRMHPSLCSFVSDAFYDGRLESMEHMARQKLVLGADAAGPLKPTGLSFVAVEHEDCSQKSEQEAERLCALYDELLRQHWMNRDGETLPITAHDILVVSPYNMQVNLLKDTLPPGARVGTVDKFQGQEAAVVLVSMASSTGDDIPRGIEFLFSRNRLNVAISRARCLSVIFASPRLLAATCSKVEQLRLVNTLCWAQGVSSRTPMIDAG